ncbi:MAG: hypothetical protein HY868_02255 [Chloroflexi bacterium]|nr:hypothetical protein [Chloroflexota bacterium]
MDIVMIVLRLAHIFGGVFWAGGTFILVGNIEPTVRGLGPEGGRFMQRFAGAGGFSRAMSIAAATTVIAGALLYWRASLGFSAAWFATGSGITLTIGALAGIAGAVVGFAINGRTANAMAALGAQIASAGGPPKPEQLAQMQAYQETLRQGGMIGGVLIAIALACMSVARYV